MEFQKIKFTKNAGVELKYTRLHETQDEVISKTDVVEKSKDEPHPDFKAALEKLVPIVRYDEGIPDKQTADITITGVSLFSDGEVCIITHVRRIASGASVRNSGRISFESEEFKKVDELFLALQELKKQAKLYVEGKRAQLDIFNVEEEAA